MKKSLVLAILGVTASVTASYGDGYIYFSNYTGSTSPTINFPATGVNPPSKDGLAYGSAFSAELLWYNGLTANPAMLTPLPASITVFGTSVTAVSPVADGDTADGAGLFVGPIVTLPGYTSGLVTLQLIVFGTEGGNSYVETFPSLYTMTPATGSMPPPEFPGTINLVPEPGTLALGALGGLSLWLFRRKKA